MAAPPFNTETVAIQNYREFIQLFNKVSNSCFNSCVVDMTSAKLSADEAKCVESCSEKMINVNHRLMSIFVEIGPPVDKQLGLSGVGGGM